MTTESLYYRMKINMQIYVNYKIQKEKLKLVIK